jgi:GntR family transcriptional regulator
MVGIRWAHSAGTPRWDVQRSTQSPMLYVSTISPASRSTPSSSPHNRPVAFEEAVLALERFPGLAANGGDVPDIVELAQRHGLSLGRATERLSIVHATKDVASRLQIAVGTDVLKLNRVVATAEGEPVEWRVTFMKI